MHIDPINLLQVSLYSKLMTNGIQNDIRYTIALMFLFAVYKFVTTGCIRDYIYDYIQQLIENTNECAIIIPQHNRKIVSFVYSTTKESTQTLYSTRFHALNHYITKHCSQNINKKIEVLKKEQKSSWDNETIDYILLPMQNERIVLNAQLGIFFEINITSERDNNKDGDNKGGNTGSHVSKNYVYKISKSGRDNYPVLCDFLEKCVKEYEDEILNKKEQQTFEYIKCEKDEDGKCSMFYRSCPFKSNKHLHKNIFFEKRGAFIDYVDRFSRTLSGTARKSIENMYEDAGITYKAGIIMHGPPGCGKSSTIRGILNRTGRHGVIIRWSSIKTCAELCSLLRSTTINNIKYEMKDLCFIFEDFDANDDDVLKKRNVVEGGVDTSLGNGIGTGIGTSIGTGVGPGPDTGHSTISSIDFSNGDTTDIPNDINELKTELIKSKKMLENMGAILITANQKKEDGLTLDCVLNAIDGIIELHDAMLIFTTNHLEKIDPAFMRPGRIDYILELKHATVTTIHEMIEYKFRHAIDDFTQYQKYFDNMRDFALSPADIQITCLKYKNDQIEECLKELVEKMQ